MRRSRARSFPDKSLRHGRGSRSQHLRDQAQHRADGSVITTRRDPRQRHGRQHATERCHVASPRSVVVCEQR